MIEHVIALFDFQNFLTKFPVGKVNILHFIEPLESEITVEVD